MGAITANVFRVVNTSGTARMHIDVDGNVGIGMTSPSERLTIQGGSDAPVLMLAQANNVDAGYQLHTSSAGGALTFSYDDTSSSTPHVYFYNDGNVTIKTDGGGAHEVALTLENPHSSGYESRMEFSNSYSGDGGKSAIGGTNNLNFYTANSGNTAIDYSRAALSIAADDGEINMASISTDGTGKVVCIQDGGDLGTCSDQPGASGTCTCG